MSKGKTADAPSTPATPTPTTTHRCSVCAMPWTCVVEEREKKKRRNKKQDEIGCQWDGRVEEKKVVVSHLG